MSEEPSQPDASPEQETSDNETKPEAKPKPEKQVASDKWDSLREVVKIIGTWAWLIGLISGIVYLFWGIFGIVGAGITGVFGGSISITRSASIVWDIIRGSICIIISLAIVLPRFSMKCKNEDWDYLLNDVWVLGSFRFPLMLLWGILLAIFGYGWGGAGVLVPAFMLLFAGPKPYEWTTE